ncbi:hypothetical protein AG1IA_01424 [Rhizoctonia solani AG-1 IA]|uniref:Uncharacterized protein n=1 Tax=Thanatephorus cucumeris (strain AG1-IA) TaxID=983506 RepID=L8X2I7_THACA|nr:hypothetical protein AG1IA_01424 [Rhizoctonia solani AG-1 IA]
MARRPPRRRGVCASRSTSTAAIPSSSYAVKVAQGTAEYAAKSQKPRLVAVESN